MSNHDVSSRMNNESYSFQLLNLIGEIKDRALFAIRNGWEKERYPDHVVEKAALELIREFSGYEQALNEIDAKFFKYAPLVDSIDLWVGSDAGPEGVIEQYYRLHTEERELA